MVVYSNVKSNMPNNIAINHRTIVTNIILFLFTQPWTEDRRRQEPTSQIPRTSAALPKLACPKTTRESLFEGCSLTVCPKPSKEGPITKKKEIAFKTTATSIIVPCEKNLFLLFKINPAKRKTRITI